MFDVNLWNVILMLICIFLLLPFLCAANAFLHAEVWPNFRANARSLEWPPPPPPGKSETSIHQSNRHLSSSSVNSSNLQGESTPTEYQPPPSKTLKTQTNKKCIKFTPLPPPQICGSPRTKSLEFTLINIVVTAVAVSVIRTSLSPSSERTVYDMANK